MKRVVIIGNASYNTLSAIRSYGEGKIPIVLIMVADSDPVFVRKSRYLKKQYIFIVKSLDDCSEILNSLKNETFEQTLVTTFDPAAEWVDAREPELSKYFRTPCRGKQIGKYFHKDEQCKLAVECGLIVPKSAVYHRGDLFPDDIAFPLLTKPLVSSLGSKSDIHICHDEKKLQQALLEESHCKSFIVQEYIEKEYELNCLGVRTETECVLAGAIRKRRHWPKITGIASFANIEKFERYEVDLEGIKKFLEIVGYFGLFSVEFLHKDGKNYFMEVNFRNDGLVYTSTAAGVNLHASYINKNTKIDCRKFHPVYMMNTSSDLLHVKNGDLSLKQWLSDFHKTTAFINFNKKDLMPTFWYYLRKILVKLRIERLFHFY